MNEKTKKIIDKIVSNGARLEDIEKFLNKKLEEIIEKVIRSEG